MENSKSNPISGTSSEGNSNQHLEEATHAEKKGKKNKKKRELEPEALSWEEKKKLDEEEEEEALEKDIKELKIWIDKVELMDDAQLKEYLKNRPASLKTVKISNKKPKQKVQRTGKSQSLSYNDMIMKSVWKFHKDDDDDEEPSTNSSAGNICKR